jgi:hypothetical protein
MQVSYPRPPVDVKVATPSRRGLVIVSLGVNFGYLLSAGVVGDEPTVSKPIV